MSQDDVQWMVQSLTTTLNSDTAYISNEQLPLGSYQTQSKTSSKDLDGYFHKELSSYLFEKANNGDVVIEKTYSAESQQRMTSYEVSSKTSYLFTPDFEAPSGFAGSFQLESSMSLKKDKGSTKIYRVTSKKLHRSFCGIDQGSIEFSNAYESYLISYSGCGNYGVFLSSKKVALDK